MMMEIQKLKILNIVKLEEWDQSTYLCIKIKINARLVNTYICMGVFIKCGSTILHCDRVCMKITYYHRSVFLAFVCRLHFRHPTPLAFNAIDNEQEIKHFYICTTIYKPFLLYSIHDIIVLSHYYYDYFYLDPQHVLYLYFKFAVMCVYKDFKDLNKSNNKSQNPILMVRSLYWFCQTRVPSSICGTRNQSLDTFCIFVSTSVLSIYINM